MAAIDEPSRKKIKTRFSMNYFLIGQSADHIGGNKLPFLGQILQYLLHLRESSPVTTPLKNHLSDAVDKILLIWSRARSKTVTKQNELMRLKMQYEKCQQLCKNKARSFDLGKKREIFAEIYQSFGILGLEMQFRRPKKVRFCQRREKLKMYFFTKTSETQEKVPLEGKMLCIRKAFKNSKKSLHDQLLSPSLAVMTNLMKSRLASQALLPQVRNTGMLNKLVQALKVLL